MEEKCKTDEFMDMTLPTVPTVVKKTKLGETADGTTYRVEYKSEMAPGGFIVMYSEIIIEPNFGRRWKNHVKANR